MNIFKQLKDLLNKVCKNKTTVNIITILMMAIIILIAISLFTSSDKTQNALFEQNNTNNQNELFAKEDDNNYESSIESKLEKILSQIEGVGKVKAMITFEDTIESVPAINTTKSLETTNEEDSEGGIREIIREDYTEQIVVSNSSNDNSVLVLKEKKPNVKGVIIVAEGAQNLMVKEKLYSAVKTVLGIPGNRVEIYASK